MKSSLPVNVGDVVDGKYRIESKIGTGGMAIVYSARHLRLDEKVALKFLDPKLRASSEAKERFAREAKASFMLRSEHIARILDVGELDAETPFIVMELLEGDTLAKWVEDQGKPPLALALALTAQACEGVAEAHSRGIVHRDIKPENLFVTPLADKSATPLLRVLDFGISKALLGESELTGTNDLIGTPLYMAPEQFSHAKKADARADVWSLGIILYWLLTGTTPFDAPTPMGVMSAILTRKPVGPSTNDSRIPRGLDDVVLRCIQQDPKVRFANATELGKALEPFVARANLALARGEGQGPPSSVTEPRIKINPPKPRSIAVEDDPDDGPIEDAPTYVDNGPNMPMSRREIADEHTVPTRMRVEEPVPSTARSSYAPPASQAPAPLTAQLPPHSPSQIPLPPPPPRPSAPSPQGYPSPYGPQPHASPQAPMQAAAPMMVQQNTHPLRHPQALGATQPLGRASLSQSDPNPPRVSMAPPPHQVAWKNPPAGDDDERRKMIIAVMLTIIVIAGGLILGLLVRACARPNAHPVG